MTGPITRATIRTSVVLGLRLVVQAGTLLVVARMLGAHLFGAFAGVAALAMILGTLSTFGTHLVLLGEVSKEPQRRARVLPYAIPTTLVCGSSLLLIFLAASTWLLPSAGIGWLTLLFIGLAEILLQPLFGLMTSEHHGLGHVAQAKMMQVFPLFLRFVAALAIYMLHWEHPLAGYAVGYFLATILALALGAWLLPSSWPRMRSWQLADKSRLQEAAGYAVLNITQAGPAELDKTLATRLLPLGAAGVYAAGARVIGATTLPVIALMVSALPRLFRESDNPLQGTGRLLRWIFGAAGAYSLFLVIILWCLAPAFNWIFGVSYQSIDHVIRMLCLAIPGMAFRICAGDILMAMGRPWMRVGFEACGLIVLVLAAILLTRNYGINGMTVALASSEWAMACTGFLMVRHAASRLRIRSVPV